MSSTLLRVLVTGASVVQVAFGVWHFFAPGIWGWYGYMVPAATELVLAVQAINFFFSLCLVLMAAENLLLVFAEPPGSFALCVLLAGSTLLWGSRVAMQLTSPQGSVIPSLRYGMLAGFVCFTLAYGVASAGALASRRSAGRKRG